MKILLATDAYKYMTNGAAGVVDTLAHTFRNEGHEVKIVTMAPSNKTFKEDDEYYFASYGLPHYPGFRQSNVRKHPYIDELKAWKPDVVHAHTEGSAAEIARLIAKAANAPFIMTVHTYYAKFMFHNLAETPPVRLLAKTLVVIHYRGADMITTPSEKGIVLMRGYNYKKDMCVIPNGINLKRFGKDYAPGEREEFFKSLGIEDNGKTFVVISRLSSEKNIGEVIKGFADVVKEEPDAHLLMVGDGPDTNHLKRLTKRLGLTSNVIFTGRIPQEELYKYYKAGIAFLSASDFEMHSLTYLEAMASGLPLICKKDPCLKGVLKNGVNGFTFSQLKGLPEKCLRLMRDTVLQEKMARAAYERSRYFSEERCAARMIDMYEGIIKEKL